MRGKKLIVVPLILVALAAALYLAASRILASDLMRSTLEQQLTARLGRPVRIGAASAAIYPRVALELHEVAVGAPASVTIGRIRIVTGLRALLSRIVQDAEVLVENGEMTLPATFDLIPAAPAPSPFVAEPPLKIASVKTIQFRRIALHAGPQQWLTDADCSLEGDRFLVSHLSAQSAVTRLQGAGELSSLARTEGQFTFSADPLDLDELIAFGSALTQPAVSQPSSRRMPAEASPMRISAAVTAASGKFASHEFRDLKTTVTIADGAMSMSPLAVAALGGRFDGRLDADTRGRVPAIRLNGRLAGLDIVEALRAAGSSGGITGRLAGSVALTAAGTDSASLLQTARGSIAAAISDGSMPRLDLVRPIVLAFGKPSGAPPEGSGSAFSRLGGTFTLAGGVLSASDITMAARDFDVNGRGTVELANGALFADGNVMLSRELTAQAGVDLRRYAQQDGRVVVPATVRGTLQQPTVGLDMAAAARRAISNEIQRRTRSLLDGLFRRPPK